jgi:hypothetical protein
MARVIGIDWATAAGDRALVELEVADGFQELRVAKVADTVDEAHTLAACTSSEHAVVAVDIPFAWPLEFVRFVSSWSPAGGAPPPISDDFRFRHTDRVVRHETKQNPLPVSADRIAMGARAWADIVARHGLASRIDTAGTPFANPPTVIEVYPGATARVLGQPKYKKSEVTRRALVGHVATLFNVDLDGRLDAIIGKGEDSDETDAFLAAITGAIYLADCQGADLASAAWSIRRPSESEMEAAAREGWIFFPIHGRQKPRVLG